MSATYNADRDEFYVVVGDSAAGKCRAYRSTDDCVSWTFIADLTTRCLRAVAVNSRLFMSMTTAGEVVYSTDGEAWRWTGGVLANTARGAFAGDGGFALVSSSDFAPTARSGQVGDQIA